MGDEAQQIRDLVAQVEDQDQAIKVAKALKGQAMTRLNRLVAAHPGAAEGIKLPGRKRGADTDVEIE